MGESLSLLNFMPLRAFQAVLVSGPKSPPAMAPTSLAWTDPPLILPTDVVIRYIGYGGQWDPTGAPWAPLGPLP